MAISASVGKNGVNSAADVAEVTRLLNENRHLMIWLPPLSGQADNVLFAAIESFQRRLMRDDTPDGRVDPTGGALRKLEQYARPGAPVLQPLFPFTSRSTPTYHQGALRFGAKRDEGARKHAGCDIYFPVNTPIRAVEAGVVTEYIPEFYRGSSAVAVNHGNFVARYCEIVKGDPNTPAIGKQVARGQVIGKVAHLPGIGNSMLHFELYADVSQPSKFKKPSLPPFNRRDDLIDPTEFLDACQP